MTDTTTIRATVGNDHNEIHELPTDVVVERDVMIPNAQGLRLAANVFRPLSGGPLPVIMCCTTYGKELHPLDYTLTGRGPANRSIGPDMGDMRVSEATPFECGCSSIRTCCSMTRCGRQTDEQKAAKNFYGL